MTTILLIYITMTLINWGGLFRVIRKECSEGNEWSRGQALGAAGFCAIPILNFVVILLILQELTSDWFSQPIKIKKKTEPMTLEEELALFDELTKKYEGLKRNTN